jgi:hypothetical protein
MDTANNFQRSAPGDDAVTDDAMTDQTLAIENARYRGTGGVSGENRGLGMRPAFLDRATGTIHLSRFADGRLAPCHLIDGLPAELTLARDEHGRVSSIKATVEAGFERHGRYYTRAEAAALRERIEHERRLGRREFTRVERAFTYADALAQA